MRISAAQTPSPRRGEGWGEGARHSELFRAVSRDQQLLTDCFENSVQIGQNVIVPETQNAITISLDDGGSRSVAIRRVLPPVQFDRQPCAAAGEVGDVGIDLELTDELLAFEPAAAEVGPEPLLDVGLVGAELAGDRSQTLPSHRRTPSPNPLPAGERAFMPSLS